MRTIIVGCGRVGSTLAMQLSLDGQDVNVVDRDARASRLLPRNFGGRFHVGNGYNRTVLETAGVDAADAFIAVTAGDNTNIVAARTAKEVYRVPAVIARIYDPRRADIYRDLGIPTVASVRWTVEKIHQMLQHRHLVPEQTYGNGETLLVRAAVPDSLKGRPLGTLEADGEVRLVEVTRAGRSFIPTPMSTAQPEDVVTVAVTAGALSRLRRNLDRELGT